MTDLATDQAPAPRTEGLDPLDQQRAASLADEGGSSGVTVEAEQACCHGNLAVAGGLAAAFGALLGFVAWRCFRR